MKNQYPEIRRGLALTLLKCLAVIALFLSAWQYGLLDKILPSDMLTWVWVSVMLAWFVWAAMIHALPYHNQIDREIRDFRNATALLRGGRENFELLYKGSPFGGKNKRNTLVAEVFRLVTAQSSLDADIREKVDLDNTLGFAHGTERNGNRTKKLIHISRDLLTLGILGTYVGITLGVIDSDAVIAGDTEETRAFVAYLFSSIGLALLTTLTGLMAGMFLNKLHEQAQVKFDRILNQLSAELPASGYLGWVNAGRPKSAAQIAPTGEE